jgi:hypothetical protein
LRRLRPPKAHHPADPAFQVEEHDFGDGALRPAWYTYGIVL